VYFSSRDEIHPCKFPSEKFALNSTPAATRANASAADVVDATTAARFERFDGVGMTSLRGVDK